MTGLGGACVATERLPDWPSSSIIVFSAFVGGMSGGGTLSVFWLPYLFLRLGLRHCELKDVHPERQLCITSVSPVGR